MIEPSSELYATLLRHFRHQFPLVNLRSHLALGAVGDMSVALRSKVTTFSYVILSQRRYFASSHSTTPENSVVAVRAPGSEEVSVGELLDIIIVDQEKLGRHVLGHMRWLLPVDVDRRSTSWAGS